MKHAVAFVALAVACRSEPPPKPPITVDRAEPSWAVPAGGTIVYVRGTNFDPKSRVSVMFGAREAPMAAVLGEGKIQVTVPPGAEGESVALTVRFPDGRSASLATPFVFRQPPHEHP